MHGDSKVCLVEIIRSVAGDKMGIESGTNNNNNNNYFLYGLVVRLNSLHSKRYLLTNQSCICTMIDYDFGISLIK